MKKSIQSALFFSAMFALCIGCQSKKTESTKAMGSDTATVIETEAVTNGDSTLVISDTTKVIVPDSAKK